MSMSLYEIDSQLESIMTRLFESADENGEIDQSILEELNQMQQARDQKLENIGAYIKNLQAESDAIDNEIDCLKYRLTRKNKRIEWLKSYVASDLLSHGQTKFEAPRVVFSFRKSSAVKIIDESKIPKKYFKKTVKYDVDRAGIKELLNLGHRVRGAELEHKQNLQIK